MKECEIVNLNGKEYFVVDEINCNGVNYLYLSNENDPTDFCIKKVIIEDGKEIIVQLDSPAEFNEALKEFTKKNS